MSYHLLYRPVLLLLLLFHFSLQAQTNNAAFEADLTYSCEGTIQFKDKSTNSPTSWLWQFGDGGISTAQNPVYTFANSGTYSVSLQVVTSFGTDTLVKNDYITIEKPAIFAVGNAEVCLNNSAQLTANNGSSMLNWYDGSNTLVFSGSTFNTPPLSVSTSYFVEQELFTTRTDYAGPKDGATVGGGGYHGGGFNGGVNFTAQKAFDIVSVWVDADGSGSRTIYLWDGFVSAQGGVNNTVLDQVTVNIPDGISRVQLNFNIPAAGDYCIGGNQMDLFRNNGSAVYPYSLPGVVDLVSSTTTSNGYYYYFYDWEIALSTTCTSPREVVTATVVTPSFSSVSNGATASFTDNSTAASSWLWDFGDGATSTEQNPVHNYQAEGPFLVTLTVNQGLCSYADSVSVSVGFESLASGLELSVFPNPASEHFNLQFSQPLPSNIELQITDPMGRKIHHQTLFESSQHLHIDISNYAKGLYYLNFFNDKMTTQRAVLIR